MADRERTPCAFTSTIHNPPPPPRAKDWCVECLEYHSPIIPTDERGRL